VLLIARVKMVLLVVVAVWLSQQRYQPS
jgi:hypothetical protein